MLSPSITPALGALAVTVVVGVITHELAHALALRMAGVSYTFGFLRGPDESSGFQASLRAPLATVTPTHVPDGVSLWHLRVAAMMPLCMAAPFGLVLAGVVPDPFATGDPALQLATIAWLGCGIPSPRDFSLLWYPERAVSALEFERSGAE